MSTELRDMSSILPGQQDATGNGDPFSLDWWEQQSLDENKIMQEHAIEKRFFEADGPISFDSPEQIAARVDRIVASTREREALSIINLAGIVGTTSVPIQVPVNCKMIKAAISNAAGMCVISGSPTVLSGAQTLDQSQASNPIGFFGARDTYFPVRQQLGTIYVTAYQAGLHIVMSFYCGSIDPADFVGR